MNDTELLALGDALARTEEVLRPGEQLTFADYIARALGSDAQIAALASGSETLIITVDGHRIEGLDALVPVTAESRVVLYRRQGPMLDVLTGGVVRRIYLN